MRGNRSWVWSWILVTLLSGTPGVRFAFAGSNPPVLAVFDIEDKTGKLKVATRRQLSEYLATKMGEGGVYQIVPQEDIRQRLAQEKTKSYKPCYDQSCQIELGREMAASLTLSSQLLGLSGQCQLTFQIIDLTKAASYKTAIVRTGCGEEALMNGIDQAAVKLGATLPAPENRTQPPAHEVRKIPELKPEAKPCPEGQILVGTHCCWPGQDWAVGSGKCMGTPRCPDGWLAKDQECQIGCPTGKALVAGHCCWLGQDWGEGSHSCIGAPSQCPPLYSLQANSCIPLSGEDLGRLCRDQAFEPCVQQCLEQQQKKKFVQNCQKQSMERCRKGKPSYLYYQCGESKSACQKLCNKDPAREMCIKGCIETGMEREENCKVESENECRRLPECAQLRNSCIEAARAQQR